MNMFKALRGMVLAAFLAVGLVAMTASAAMAAGCAVENTTSHAKYAGTLQEAVEAAGAGNTLKVSGTCEGETTIGKSVTITGKSAAATILKGTGASTVVTISPGTTVKITKITITGGHGETGGGITNKGTLALTKATVRANTATNRGGGISNDGTLTLKGSTVSGNTAYEGGGISNEEDTLSKATVTLSTSTVSGNTASEGGGGISTEGGAVTLTASTVKENTARLGGGIFNGFGTVTLNHKTVITKNTAAFGGGGGICNTEHAKLIEAGGTVTENTPENVVNE